MRFARFFALAAAFATASCAQQVAVDQRTQISSRLPAVDGRSELLSALQIQAIFAATRQKLATREPWARIYKVTVHSATKAEAFYGEPDDPHGAASFIFEFVRGEWRITGEGGWEY